MNDYVFVVLYSMILGAWITILIIHLIESAIDWYKKRRKERRI